MTRSSHYIVADFDATLTQAYIEGKKRPSLISVLRDHDYLGQDYADQAHALYDHYSQIENDSSLPFEERKQAMQERWGKHFDLLIEKKLSKTHFHKIIQDGHIQMRDGYQELFDFLHINAIPMIIISASGLGTEMITMMLDHAGVDRTHIHIISNKLIFDTDGYLSHVEKPYIHGLNKDETELQQFGYKKYLSDRKDIILLGDSINDLLMTTGSDHKSLVSFGFLNDLDASPEKKAEYTSHFDYVIENDGTLFPVVEYMQSL